MGEWRAAGDLADASSLAPPSISEHLKVLRKSRLVELDRRGRFWLYRTNPEVIEAAARALDDMARRSGAG